MNVFTGHNIKGYRAAGSGERCYIVFFRFSQKSSITYYCLNVLGHLETHKNISPERRDSHLNVLILVPQVLRYELHRLSGLVRLRREEDVGDVAVPPLSDWGVVVE